MRKGGGRVLLGRVDRVDDALFSLDDARRSCKVLPKLSFRLVTRCRRWLQPPRRRATRAAHDSGHDPSAPLGLRPSESQAQAQAQCSSTDGALLQAPAAPPAAQARREGR